ncbi:hypothetical protein DEA8626_02345 [Defluviimonas aquaemixtae]|uniref:Cytochrome c domain-containing protein n=1 Tax=Albidovulum aquaemixtae TaxID=1542388 RepID=A0A2R8B833_9RHOB|nr:hypothetical protein [Defluviimonas aquaemixtae]SPH18800.1 hypothetical protein DEA8626_02345 [Defluviimonas aquaemixtae]
MRRPAFHKLMAVIAALLGTAVIGLAQEDVFDFIPVGGRTLLENLRAEGMPADLEGGIGSQGGDAEAWRARLEAAGAEAPSLEALDAWQTDTLAYYLAANAPLASGVDLPRDGRDMALALCQSCHIITVVVTQERTREAWLRTMNGPSHVEIATTPAEREALADYLVINAGIPIDQIPPELRAGGASY